VTAWPEVFPLELSRGHVIGMDPPKHARIKALFQRGFTPRCIPDHEDRIRQIVRTVLDRLERRETSDLVRDLAQPVVSRVIGSFMDIPRRRMRSGRRLSMPPSSPTTRISAPAAPNRPQEGRARDLRPLRRMIAARRDREGVEVGAGHRLSTFRGV
jgi:cytochrome P450